MKAYYLAIGLILLAACTKKKAEPDMEMPADSNHQQASELAKDELPKADENGAIFIQKKMSPVEILKMTEIKNQQEKYASTKANTAAAKAIYDANCARCHGAEGKGDGPDERSLGVTPTNFHQAQLKYGSEIADLAFTISYGRNEGEMPPFHEILSEEEIWTVAYYVDAWVASQGQ